MTFYIRHRSEVTLVTLITSSLDTPSTPRQRKRLPAFTIDCLVPHVSTWELQPAAVLRFTCRRPPDIGLVPSQLVSPGLPPSEPLAPGKGALKTGAFSNPGPCRLPPAPCCAASTASRRSSSATRCTARTAPAGSANKVWEMCGRGVESVDAR